MADQNIIYVQQPAPDTKDDGLMTVGNWILTLFLLWLPIINLICCICWFFGIGNRSRTNFIRAYVVVFLIVIGLGLAIFGLIAMCAMM